MPAEIVLLTGASGFLGFRILEKLLEEGRHVRLAVRSDSKSATLEQALKRLGQDTPNTEHVVVPDMTAPDAFKDAIKGVSYVIHVASPMPQPSDDLEASVIKPASAITTGFVNTILQSPERSVKKLVITSSVAAIVPAEHGVMFDADNVAPDPKGPWTDTFGAYADGKKLAYNATRRLIDEQKPYFDVIHVMPSFILGPNHLIERRKEYTDGGSNAYALVPLLGAQIPGPVPGAACHVDDVAEIHVKALSPAVKGHRNYGVNFDGKNGGVALNDAIDIVKKRLPEAVGPDKFPLGGSVGSAKTLFDASKTESELGMKFKDFETMIVDLASAYVAAKA